MTHLFATPVALAQPFLCAWPCFAPQPTAPPSWQSPQSVGWFWPFCFWCVFGFQGAMRDLSEKNRPKPQDFSSRASTQKKKWILRHPCSPCSAPAAHPFQPPLVANPSPLHREHVVLMVSQSAGPRSIVSWSLRFFLVFSMGFPPEIVWSMFLSDFHPATCRWDVTLLTLVEGHFHRIHETCAGLHMFVTVEYLKLPSPVQIKPKLRHVPEKELSLRYKS